jgi:ribosomal protein S6--L-glutamate ligase
MMSHPGRSGRGQRASWPVSAPGAAPASAERPIAFVLGKPPRGSSVLSEVIDSIRLAGLRACVHLPHEAAELLPPWLFEVQLVVQRGLDSTALAAMRRVEAAGVRCCNPVGATLAVRDRLLQSRRLADAGVPVPSTVAAATWPAVLRASQGRAVVVKSRHGARGRGAAVLLAPDGVLPRSPTFEGPYVVEDLVAGDGQVRKLYVAGKQVQGLLKSSAPAGPLQSGVDPLQPSRSLIHLAHRTGRALGLEIYGLDVIGPGRPVVVDVNPFPGFRGVPQAAVLIVRHLLSVLPPPSPLGHGA